MERLAGGPILENEFLRIEIGEDGALRRVVDKAVGDRDALAGHGDQLGLSSTNRAPRRLGHRGNYEDEGEEIGGIEAIEVVGTDRCAGRYAFVAPGGTRAWNRRTAC